MKFRVEYISSTDPTPFVVMRQVGLGDFDLGPNPTLGEVPVVRRMNRPRAMRADGAPDHSIFAFQLLSPSDLTKLTPRQFVELSG